MESNKEKLSSSTDPQPKIIQKNIELLDSQIP